MLLNNAFISQLNQLGKTGEPFLFIIDFEGISPLVYPLSAIPDTIKYSFPGLDVPHRTKISNKPIILKKCPVAFSDYHVAFQKVLFHLKQGNSYLVNLTFPTPVSTDLSLDEIYGVSKAPYKLLLKDQFVVFSPEPFIQIKGNVISSFPMKGTIDASIPDAGKRILSDTKESAEHNTIVDLIRNDLSKVATQVEVVRYRYLQRIQTHQKEILQVSSEIRGLLAEGFQGQIGHILDSLLPAGSISGAPKQSTLNIIRESETGPRGYYTGVFGIFDGQNLESAVMIRFIRQSENGLIYHSGGGITHLSHPESEYQEMLDKVYLQTRSDE